MAEFPDLGKRCSLEYCNQLDFLPVDCDGCGKTFCVKHQVKTVHGCTEHLWLQKTSVEYAGPGAFSCSVEGCGNKELTPVVCEHCHLQVCLRHRHQQDHGCKELKEVPVRNARTAHHVSEMLAKRGSQPAEKKFISAKSRKMAAQLTLMKLKGKAEGDRGIPEGDRIFFSVAMPRASQQGVRAFFVSKVWPVGRAIDFIADQAGLTNPNNTGAPQKLRLFNGDTGHLLVVDKKLSELLESDGALYNGSFVILECVPQELTSLPDVELYSS